MWVFGPAVWSFSLLSMALANSQRMVSMSTGLARTSSELVVGSATTRMRLGVGFSGGWALARPNKAAKPPRPPGPPCCGWAAGFGSLNAWSSSLAASVARAFLRRMTSKSPSPAVVCVISRTSCCAMARAPGSCDVMMILLPDAAIMTGCSALPGLSSSFDILFILRIDQRARRPASGPPDHVAGRLLHGAGRMGHVRSAAAASSRRRRRRPRRRGR